MPVTFHYGSPPSRMPRACQQAFDDRPDRHKSGVANERPGQGKLSQKAKAPAKGAGAIETIEDVNQYLEYPRSNFLSREKGEKGRERREIDAASPQPGWLCHQGIKGVSGESRTTEGH